MGEKKKIKSKPLSNSRWELFCQFYVKNASIRMNATFCYAEAYEYDLDSLSSTDAVYAENPKGGTILVEESSYRKAYNTCSVEGHRLLRTPKINDRLTILLNELLTNKQVDAELAKVIIQDRELPAKVNAIREYNKLNQRIIEKSDITSSGDKIVFMPPEILNKHKLNEKSSQNTKRSSK